MLEHALTTLESEQAWPALADANPRDRIGILAADLEARTVWSNLEFWRRRDRRCRHSNRYYQPIQGRGVVGHVVAELDAAANQLSHLLYEAGLRPGDHIALCMENHPRYLEALWGCQSFYRAFSTVNGGRTRETDLFEGIRA